MFGWVEVGGGGGGCPLGFSLVVFLFCAVLVVGVPFQFSFKGRMWNSIVPVPDPCLVICFETYPTWRTFL